MKYIQQLSRQLALDYCCTPQTSSTKETTSPNTAVSKDGADSKTRTTVP